MSPTMQEHIDDQLAAGVDVDVATAAAPVTEALQKKSRLLVVLAAMGPGIITAMAGNDAGGIATYSQVGALFGYQSLWALPIM